MEFVAEIILQAIAEIFLQLVAEILVELGYRSLADKIHRRRHPVLSTIGFAIVGAAAGGLSLIAFPDYAISEPALRAANLLVTPTVVGMVMAMIGKWRTKRGQDLIPLDKFAFAFVFAFAMGLVRYIWAA